MAKEIERKFLVVNDSYKQYGESELYIQGYLCRVKERTVRVRIAGSKAYLTVKGIQVGAMRSEYEYEIPLSEAQEMLNELCEKPLIEKIRYKASWKGNLWEIDELHGANQGLVVAELEMPSEDYRFELPPWVGQEVTGDSRYSNASLVEHPFSEWSKNGV